MEQAWTEKIWLIFHTKIDFQWFQGAAGVGPYMWLLTDEQEPRGSSFNYYGSQIFPNQIINKEPSSRTISPEPTSSIGDTSAAAAQKKKKYETLTKEEEKYLLLTPAHKQHLFAQNCCIKLGMRLICENI